MLAIKIQGHRSTDFPKCRIKFNNDCLYDNAIVDTMNLKFDVNLSEKNILHVEHYDKVPSDTIINSEGMVEADRAIELQSIAIDGYVVPKVVMYRQKFYVDWWDHDIENFDKKKQPVPGFLTNNVYFGYNGTYEYSFNNDLAKQYYLSLWEEETIANQDLQQINEYDGQIKETFNLYGNESDISEEFNKTIFDLLDMIDK